LPEGKESTSFFEKKEAKKLLFPAVRAGLTARARVQKFLGSFFQKRTLS
jgi:hypothetical protein